MKSLKQSRLKRSGNLCSARDIIISTEEIENQWKKPWPENFSFAHGSIHICGDAIPILQFHLIRKEDIASKRQVLKGTFSSGK